MLGNNPVNFTDYLGLMEGGTDQAMAIMGKNVVYQSIDGQYHNFPQGFVKDHLDKAKTWAKATGNSLQQACSFGVWGPDYYAFGEPSLRDKVNGYETAAIVSRIGSELALGWITGYGGTMVFAAKLTIGMRFACGAMFIIDSSRNLYDTYQGAMAIAENGLSFQSSLQLFGGAFGLGGNIAGFTHGLSQIDGVLNSRLIGNAEKSIVKNAPKSAGGVTREALIESLKGGTRESGEIAEALARKEIRLSMLGDELFEKAAIRRGFQSSDIAGTRAFCWGEYVYLRRSSMFLSSDMVHEGIHALDFFRGGINYRWTFLSEFRAYRAQQLFQHATIGSSEFSSRFSILRHVWSNYSFF